MTLVSDLFKPIRLVSQRTKHQFSRTRLHGILQLSAKKQIYFSPQPSGHPVDARQPRLTPDVALLWSTTKTGSLNRTHTTITPRLDPSFWSNTVLIKSDGFCYQQQGFSALGDGVKKGASVASFLWSTLVLMDLFPTLKKYIYILNSQSLKFAALQSKKKQKSHEFRCSNSHPSQTVCDWNMTGLHPDQTNTHMLSQVRREDRAWTSSCLVHQHYVLIGRMDGRKSASFSTGLPISRGSRQPVSSQDR